MVTIAQVKQAIEVAIALGVPTTAEFMAGSVHLALSPLALTGASTALTYNSGTDSWSTGAGNPANSTAVVFPVA